MEFAEWVVSGLDQLRLGQLPAGNDFYAVVSAGLGGDPRLAAYMNSGDATARAELVQVIADAVAANPGFEQQLRTAAAAAQPQQQGPVTGGKPPFLKTTNGMLVLIAAAVVLVGGGIGLAVGLSGGGGNVAAVLKGTWTCKASGAGAGDTGADPVSFTVGDGTWSAGSASGTWKQNGSSATLHDNNEPDSDIKVSGLPDGTGSFNLSMGTTRSQLVSVNVKGTLSTHRLTVTLPGDGGDVTFTCTK